MPVSHTETLPRITRRSRLPEVAAGAIAASLLAGCTMGQPSSPERLRSAQQEATKYALGQLANHSCKIDELNVCRIGKLRNDHRTTASSSLVLNADKNTLTLRSGIFTNDGARTAYDTGIVYAVEPPHTYQLGDKLTTNMLATMVENGTVQTLECTSSALSTSSPVTLTFDAAGKPILASDSLLSEAASCLDKSLALLNGHKQQGS